MDWKGIKQVYEELRARLVHVGVGDRHVQALDAHQQHMGVGGADVVLDDQARSCPDDRGIEPRMVELECPRALKAAHEGGDDRLVVGDKPVSVGAGNNLVGALYGETVQRLVQIHDEAMQAICSIIADRRQSSHVGVCQLSLSEGKRRRDRREPRFRRLAEAPIRRVDRLDHGGDIFGERLAEPAEARRLDHAARARPSAGDERLDRNGIDSSTAAFGRKIGGRDVAMMGVLHGSL